MELRSPGLTVTSGTPATSEPSFGHVGDRVSGSKQRTPIATTAVDLMASASGAALSACQTFETPLAITNGHDRLAALHDLFADTS